jgi:hypothetical protein
MAPGTSRDRPVDAGLRADQRADALSKRMLVISVVAAVVLVGLGTRTFFSVSSKSSSQPGTVTARDGGTVRLGDAALTVPAGATTSTGRLSASTSQPPPATGKLGDRSGVGLALASIPVSFTLTGTALKKPAKLSVAIQPSVARAISSTSQTAETVWLAFYDPATGGWQPVPSRYDPTQKAVWAEVPHLSWWAAWTWDWAHLDVRLRQNLSTLGPGRAPPSSCPTVAQVAIANAGAADPPIIGCAVQVAPEADLTISITNNRAYALVLQGPPEATPGPPTYKGFAEYERSQPAVIHALGGIYLAPTSTVTYTLPYRGNAVTFDAAPSWKTHVFDLTVAAANATFGVVTAGYSDCILDSVARSDPAPVSDAPGMIMECFPGLAQGLAIYKFYTQYTSPLLDFVKIKLADYDQLRDTLLDVHGQVQVTRPALRIPDLFIRNGVERGALHRHPSFPASIAIDNHDYYSDLKWTIGPAQATATGNLNERVCDPDCATGTWATFPIKLVASNPQQCSVIVYQHYSDNSQSIDAYVFDSISVQSLGGNPSSDLIGGHIFSRACK